MKCLSVNIIYLTVSMAPIDQMESGANGKISNSERKKKKSKKRAKRKTDLELAGSSRHGIPSFLQDSAEPSRHSFLQDSADSSNYVKSKEDEELEMINKFAAGQSTTFLRAGSERRNKHAEMAFYQSTEIVKKT